MQNKYVEDRKYRYLEMLQGIIARMAECSFKCKEFCILIVSALLAVLATNIRNHFFVLYIGAIPCFVFWILDSYYLTQERAFRNLYKQKAVFKEQDLAFEDCNFIIEKPTFGDYFKTFWSKTIWPLYSILVLILIGGAIVLTINYFNGIIPFFNEAASSVQ